RACVPVLPRVSWRRRVSASPTPAASRPGPGWAGLSSRQSSRAAVTFLKPMAKIGVLGAGIPGHTAPTLLRQQLPLAHEIVVISPEPEWNWIPSNIWVGVGVMPRRAVVFPLATLYARRDIEFRLGRATAIRPEGTPTLDRPHVEYHPAEAPNDTPPHRET